MTDHTGAEGVDLDEAVKAAAPLLYEADRDKDETVPWGDFRPTDVASIVLASVSKIRATIAVRAAAPIIRRPVEQERDAVKVMFNDEVRWRNIASRKVDEQHRELVALRARLADAERQCDQLERDIETIVADWHRQAADAERDALNRAADIVGAMPYDAYAYEAEALLRERAKAVSYG